MDTLRHALLFYFDTKYHYVALTGLELSVYNRLPSFSCLCPVSAKLKGMYHYTGLPFLLFLMTDY